MESRGLKWSQPKGSHGEGTPSTPEQGFIRHFSISYHLFSFFSICFPDKLTTWCWYELTRRVPNYSFPIIKMFQRLSGNRMFLFYKGQINVSKGVGWELATRPLPTKQGKSSGVGLLTNLPQILMNYNYSVWENVCYDQMIHKFRYPNYTHKYHHLYKSYMDAHYDLSWRVDKW